ncbi:MAG: serine/threonine-protein kinase [Planctomycetota bacterium]
MDGPTDIKQKGDMVEGFRVLSEIGRGAASVVYLVQDVKSKQIWALKHLQKNNPKEQRFLDQAIAEHKVAQELDHDSIRKIPKCIKKGSLLNVKELYLVMEWVDGESMDVTPPKTFEAAVDIFRQVALGLGHMHHQGFVHADMKPNNVVVNDDNRAKIIDLGQSCKVGTVKERIQGTPDYIAPEQVHRREIVPATDIYNLGAMMYWILTRKNIPTALAKGDRLVGSIDNDLLEKPTPVNELNPKIPERLSDLIMQCVEVDIIDRPKTMQVVADRLELVLGQLIAAAGKQGGGRSLGVDRKKSG